MRPAELETSSAPHIARVVVADTRNLRAITHAKVKSDPVDARMLARLLSCDMLPEVWRCDEQTRVLRRRVSRRTQLVRQRTRAKNQVHAVADPQTSRESRR